jgi:hypothetical protein
VAVFYSGGFDTESAKFDYEIKGNKLFMTTAPVENIIPYWNCYDNQGRHVNDPLFVHGKVNGENRVFTLSSKANGIAPCNVSENRVDIYLGSVEHSAPLTRKEVFTSSDNNFWAVTVAIVLFMGAICFLDSYRIVLVSLFSGKV